MKHLIVIVLISLFTIQCGVYNPNNLNVPLLSEKGEGNIGGHIGINGIQLQTSIAISDKYAFMYNNMFTGEEGSIKASSFHELAIGQYSTLGKRGKLELFVGGGFNPNYNRFFIQPNIGAQWEALELGFSTRLSQVFLTSAGKKHTYDNVILENAKPTLFVEPAITLKLGIKSFKLIAQGGLSLPVYGTSEIIGVPLILSVGLNLNLRKKTTSKPSFY